MTENLGVSMRALLALLTVLMTGSAAMAGKQDRLIHGGLDEWQAVGLQLPEGWTRLAPAQQTVRIDANVLVYLPELLPRVGRPDVQFPDESEPTQSNFPLERNRVDPTAAIRVTRNESTLPFANNSHAFEPDPWLGEETDPTWRNSSNGGSTESSKHFDGDEDDDTWTEIGIYGFLVAISGDVRRGDVDVDIDWSFSDILKNLDAGGMGAVRHRRGNWSILLDALYLKVSDTETVAKSRSLLGPGRKRSLSVKLDAEFQQALVEGFVGYRVFDREYETTRLSIDAMGGLRYNYIKVDVDAKVSARRPRTSFTKKASKDADRDWFDGVIGARVQYGERRGWSVSGWADYGVGQDSTSFQLMGVLNYRFDDSVQVLAGYRYYNMDYRRGSGGSRREIDLDYDGPMIGVEFTF